MAALTMSFDSTACRYAAAVQTNGYRVEMITPANVETMLVPLFKEWVKRVGNGTGRITSVSRRITSNSIQDPNTFTITVMASPRDNILMSSSRRLPV